MKEADLEQFVKVSKLLGSNPAYAQGGGGNISIKLPKFQMAIKASGIRLEDLSHDFGYCVVDLSTTLHLQIDEFISKLNSISAGHETKPSMELGFHALLGKAVIHTHSVYINILTCSVQGQDIARHLFPESIWIPYVSPGDNLTRAIANRGEYTSQVDRSTILFIENHGVIISSATLEQAFEIHEFINEKVKNFFKIEAHQFVSDNFAYGYSFDSAKVLFPDQVVYTCNPSENTVNSLHYSETVDAYNFIHRLIGENGLDPKFLSLNEVNELMNMQEEEYRRELIK